MKLTHNLSDKERGREGGGMESGDTKEVTELSAVNNRLLCSSRPCVLCPRGGP